MIYLVTNNSNLKSTNEYRIIDVNQSLELLSPLSNVGFDTETEGFSPFLKKLLLVQLGNKDFQVVIDCRTVDIKLYKDYFESKRTFIGWNLKFDTRFMYYHGIIMRRLYDGYLAEKLLYLGYPAGMHSLSLKSAGKEYLDIDLDKTVRGEILWRKELTDNIIIYGANDVRYLEDIMNKQLNILRKRGQEKAIMLENAVLPAIAYLEYCGIYLDKDKWKAKMIKDEALYNDSLNKLNKWVVEHYADDRRFCNINLQGDLFLGYDKEPKCLINWNSGQQVIKLFKEIGFNLTTKDKNKGGMKESVDSSIIEHQKHISDIAPIYLEYKVAQKVISTYGQNFLDLINPVTGRIHTNFSQIGTDTARLSCGGGEDKEVIPGKNVAYVNLQNLPADEETRACFCAEKGNKFISQDFSGEESILLANISQDKELIELFTTGCKDLHSLVAKMIFKDELKDIKTEDVKKKRPDLRKAAKAPE